MSIERDIQAIVFDVATSAKSELSRKVSRWRRTRASFTVRPIRDGYKVVTDNDIYRYVVDGTRPHVIKPKRAKRLRFKPQGTNSFVFAKRVNHPGTRSQYDTYIGPVEEQALRRLEKKIDDYLKRLT